MKFRATESKHEVQASSSGKAEAAAWLKAKAEAGMLATKEADLAEQALSQVAPAASKGKKAMLALKDKEDEDDEEGDGNDSASDEPEPVKKKKKVDANAEEAELLSDIGASKNKELASNRVKKMVAPLERVKKEKGTDSEKGQKVEQCLKNLKKVEKLGSKISLESAKNQLFEAALAVKRVTK